MSYFHLEVLKQFLTVKETTFVLNVSVDTVYKLIHSKALVAKKISPRKTIISGEELQRYINSK